MNNSKKERTAFRDLSDEVVFLLLIPSVISICYALIRFIFPGFWAALVTICSVTTIALIIAVRTATGRDDSMDTLRNVLIVSLSTVALTVLITKNNSNQNHLGSVLWVVAIVSTVLFLVFLFSGNNFRVLRYGKYYYYSGLSKMITIFVIIGMFLEMYTHFGTQFIWVPMIVLISFIMIVSDDPQVDDYLKSNEKVGYLIWVPIGIAISSTLYQFWFFKIVYGYVLWQVLLGVVIVLLGIWITAFYKKKVRKSEERKLEKEESIQRDAQRKAQAKQQEDEHAKVLQAITETLRTIKTKEDGPQKWKDILSVAKYYGQDIRSFSDMLPHIHRALLEELVSISKIKKHIVWTNDFQEALQLIERYAVKLYDDRELDRLIAQMASFTGFIHQYKDFKGYPRTMEEIQARCPTIFNLLSEK